MSLINFNNEQKLIQTEIRKFAISEIEPEADNIEKDAKFPTEIIKKLSELGLSGMIIPEKYAGAEMDTTSLCITVEELAKVSASIGTILAVNNCLIAYPMMKFADESIKEKYLEKIALGEIGGYVCLPDIESPEDTFEIKNSNGNYVISGKRDFVLNGEAAKFFIMPVPIYQDEKVFFLFDKADEIKSENANILGIRSAGVTNLEFDKNKFDKDNCFISAENGDKVHSAIRDYANICFSAISVGLAQASLDAAADYSKERKQFGKLISKFDMVREMLANMKIKIDTARLLVYDAATRVDSNQDFSISSKIARHYSGEIAVDCGLDAIQIHGGYGYVKDYPVERYFRDAKVLQILETTPRILKSEIAEEVLK